MCGIWILIIIILFIILIYYPWEKKEYMAPLSVFDNPHGYFYVLQTPRENMSYDIRGDPFRIPRREFVWNNSSIPMYEAEPVFYGDLI